MPIKKLKDDITNITSGYILQGCNAQGKMNSGVAKAIRNKWPKVYYKYSYHYNSFGLITGDCIPVRINKDLCVVNMITQEFYGYDNKKYVSYDAIDQATKTFADNTPEGSTVYFPLIGAGLGGGNWDIIEKILETNLSKFECYLVELGTN